jgi:hypothetical protein
MLGHIDWDGPSPSNERAGLRVLPENAYALARNKLVRVCDRADGREYLGQIVRGPFFPADTNGDRNVLAEVEIQGELFGGKVGDTNRRPAPGSEVFEVSDAEARDLLECTGDLVLGSMSGSEDVLVALRGRDKGVLPRNLGIFGTVGSGKSNTSQVIIEEASRAGWAVVVVDVEGEYVEMDSAAEGPLTERLPRFGRKAVGLSDFRVFHPASCASDRKESEPFCLRLADFEGPVIAELLETTLPERNALFECIDHFQTRNRNKVATNEREALAALLDASPEAKVAFQLRSLRERAAERSSRNTENSDFVGLSSKLGRLVHSGAFDEPRMRALDVVGLLTPGRVSIIDVSSASEAVQNLVTADLLRKSFAYKVLEEKAPPTLLVIEEAHAFISRERVVSMQATLQMLRSVTRRGRKRWLAVAFVSQQPGHLPAEIFELCNTRVVHNLRSMHNLEALMATAGDVSHEMWARCPLLAPGEALLSSPQLRRPVVVDIRPASARRRFVR